MNYIDQIRGILVGKSYNCFQLSDWWTFSFDQYKLVCHEIAISGEAELAQHLSDYIGRLNPVDGDDVSRCTAVAAQMRKPISRVELDAECNLSLEFDNGGFLAVLANVGTVDWQWCINQSGGCPHTNGYDFACFNAGEIEAAAG